MVMFIFSVVRDERKKVKLPAFGFGKIFSSLPVADVLGNLETHEERGITVSVRDVVQPETV